MLFSSPVFFLFFAIYFFFHRVLPPRLRLALVILGSTVFYAYWNVSRVWIPFALIAVAYWGVVWMESARFTVSRATRLTTLVAFLLFPLFFFKYTDFVYALLAPVFHWPSRKLVGLSLPLGISFITFTLIAYAVDVYRRRFPIERRFSLLAGSVLFFPHLIAGPIVRPSQLIPQLARTHRAGKFQWKLALAFFTWGLVKKLGIADPLAAVVDGIYRNAGAASLSESVLAFYAFAVQIYCDFSGYSDMALGLALALGIRLPLNFNRPYVSLSLIEFWRRWHITLSSWLRDYLYIPLGGNRRGFSSQIRNIFITMALGGLWHGANLTFLMWGCFHGVGIALSHIAVRHGRIRFPPWVATVLTFHFVALGWVLFRAPDFSTVFQIWAGFGKVSGFSLDYLSGQIFPLFLILVFFLVCRWDAPSRVRFFTRRSSSAFFWAFIAVGWLLSIALSAGSSAQFIYFEF